MSAPSPDQFATELARRFGPPADATFPQPDAVNRLVLRAVREVYGPQHPLSEFLKNFERAEIKSFPANRIAEDAETVDECIEHMRSAFETIEQQLLAEVEHLR